jgi:hypothetical protein
LNLYSYFTLVYKDLFYGTFYSKRYNAFVLLCDMQVFRRVLHVPLRTHNDVVVSLSNKLPIFYEICRRIFVFPASCLKSDNAIVRRICEHTVQEKLKLGYINTDVIFCFLLSGISYVLT